MLSAVLGRYRGLVCLLGAAATAGLGFRGGLLGIRARRAVLGGGRGLVNRFLERRRRLGVVSSCEALASSSEEPRRRSGFVSGSSKAAGEATSGAAWKTGAWKSSDAAGAMGAFDSVVTILQLMGARPMPGRARFHRPRGAET